MYSISRITEGIGIENRAECNHWAELSSAFATPLRISTTARRAVHTLIGSKEAFRTSTREFILKSKYNLASTILSKFAGRKLIYQRTLAGLRSKYLTLSLPKCPDTWFPYGSVTAFNSGPTGETYEQTQNPSRRIDHDNSSF